MNKLKTILKFKYVIIILIILLFISVVYKLFIKEKLDIKREEFTVEVIDVSYIDERYKVVFYDIEYILCYLDSFNYQIGDTLYIKGTLSLIDNVTIPNVFNYKDYLRYQDINYKLEVKDIKLISKNHNVFKKIKTFLINKIQNYQSKNYLYSLIIGNSNYLDRNIKSNYQKLGISHLFAISGTHITLLTLVFSYLYKKKKLNNKIYIILVNILVLFYLFLTNYKVSIIRFILFFNLANMNKKYKLDYSNTKIMIIVIFITLIINPYYFFQNSFLYSYLVSFFLIRFNYLIKGNYISRLLKLSIIAIIASFPLTIYYNYEINLLSIIYNLIYVPYISLLIFPLCFLSILFPFLDHLLILLLNILESSVNYLSKINILTFIFKKPSIIIVIIYILLIYLMLSKRKYLPFILLLIIHYNVNKIIKDNYVLTFDVSQGDSSLIKVDNKIILIDTGGSINKEYSKDIISYLKSDGIRYIDYLILSHGDFDHMGESINIVNNYKVDKVIFNIGDYNELEKDLINVLNTKNIPYYQNIKELNLGNNKLLFLNTKDYNNENDNSNVIYMKINNYKFLFMGDAGIQKEKDIINKYKLDNIDYLKVGHHGSNTSSSKEFINTINPKYSIISVGKYNKYGHPNNEVLNNLGKTTIIRTDIDGSIMFRINNDLTLTTYPP